MQCWYYGIVWPAVRMLYGPPYSAGRCLGFWHLCHMCCSFYHTSSFAARSSFTVDFETQECGDVSAWRKTGFYQNSGIRPTYQPKQFSCVFFNCARNDFEAVKSFDSTVSVVSAHFRLRTLKLSPRDYLPIFWHNLTNN